ncbi:uncharacterized protein LOC132727816 [Ruditapes philippinarum]|uniref:uncharacterized protein LOC132727816 n=1 Tax=Ruditapes philippinarum TaxID=129788 RepID=UPI00295ADCC0|nr:uncharacterized protein LOC132727816 [Ruditapes philippinarum]
MEERHRSALRRVRLEIVKDLDLGTKLYAELIRAKIFKEDQIEQIKAQSTTCDQVNKLLDFLPKRGPQAFDKFLNLVKKDYNWLADELENELEKVSPGNQIKQLPSNSHENLSEHEQTQEMTNTYLTTAAAFNGTHTDTNKKLMNRGASPIQIIEPIREIIKNRRHNATQTEEGLFANADDKAINEGDLSKTKSHPAESTNIESLDNDDVNHTNTALPWNKQVQMEAMKQLYTKVIGITSQNTETVESKEVTWEHMNCEIDKLAEMLRNSDDSKMLNMCYEILPNETSRQPLNQTMKSLLQDKENLHKEVKKLEKICEKLEKENEKYIDDVYKKSNELKKVQNEHDKALKKIKENCETLLDAKDKTCMEQIEEKNKTCLEQIEEKNKKIEDLEKKVEELSAQKPSQNPLKVDSTRQLGRTRAQRSYSVSSQSYTTNKTFSRQKDGHSKVLKVMKKI